ncbi:MAG TPA: hypothetical protein VMS65_08605 [Polyangiaceae bacterium]|nr:hypothetical protein [Polyangiaceae bacterium]
MEMRIGWERRLTAAVLVVAVGRLVFACTGSGGESSDDAPAGGSSGEGAAPAGGSSGNGPAGGTSGEGAAPAGGHSTGGRMPDGGLGNSAGEGGACGDACAGADSGGEGHGGEGAGEGGQSGAGSSMGGAGGFAGAKVSGGFGGAYAGAGTGGTKAGDSGAGGAGQSGAAGAGGQECIPQNSRPGCTALFGQSCGTTCDCCNLPSGGPTACKEDGRCHWSSCRREPDAPCVDASDCCGNTSACAGGRCCSVLGGFCSNGHHCCDGFVCGLDLYCEPCRRLGESCVRPWNDPWAPPSNCCAGLTCSDVTNTCI